MGSYDCYCAFCGGPIRNVGAITFGSKNPKARVKRLKRIAKEQRKARGDPPEEEKPREDEDENAITESDVESLLSVSTYGEENSYDPAILSPSDIGWLQECKCLGFNAEAAGTVKAFFSGRGTYDDYGTFVDEEGSDDPNYPEGDHELLCYNSYNEDITHSYPFHEACYGLFELQVVSNGYPAIIDKDALYSAFTSLSNEGDRCLEVDYGAITGQDQFWDCHQGEEYSVSDPSVSARYHQEVRQALRDLAPAIKSHIPDRSAKVIHDPLSKLPYDVLHLMVEFLPFQDLKSLFQASDYVHQSSQGNQGFWKALIRREITPWFQEIEDFRLLADSVLQGIDWKRAFLYLDHITTATLGMEGPWMGVANRRRIWNASQLVVELYLDRAPPPVDEDSDSIDEETRQIWNDAINLHLPVVAHPKVRDTRKAPLQFIRSWAELEQPCTLETTWTAEGALAEEICVYFGDEYDEETRNRDCGAVGGQYRSAEIAADEWIEEMVLHIKEIDMFTEEQVAGVPHGNAIFKFPNANAFIKGLTLVLTSGRSIDMHTASIEGCNQRPLIVAPNRHLIGVTSLVSSETKMFTHLGLLQAIRPDDDPAYNSGMEDLEDETYSHPQIKKLLWKPEAASVPVTSEEGSAVCPIWRHPTLQMQDFEFRGGHDVPTDLLPHHALIWAHDAAELKFLRRISAFQVNGGTVHFNENGRAMVSPIPDIIGFRTEHISGGDGATTTTRSIGTGGPVRSQDPNWATWHSDIPKPYNPDPHGQAWYEESMVHLDIDGATGEIVTEVHVAREAKAIQLRTNRGGKVYWGEGRRGEDDWTVLRAEEGRVIAGLVVCFGHFSGWNGRDRRNSHCKTTTVTILTVPAAEAGEEMEE